MTGVPQPAYPIVEPFGKNAGPTYIQLPVPVASQIGITPGIASFDDGFVPLNMTDPSVGGIPPKGSQMNGVLYMITQYCALLQAGEICSYSAGSSVAFGGYSVGAKLASISTPGIIWTNLVNGNTNDPDVDSTGWYSNIPLYVSVSPTAGQHDNYVLPGASDYAIDINTAAGEVDISGFVAQRDGQTLYLSCTGSNIFQALASSTSSSAANRIRAATNLAILQDSTLTIKYFSGVSRWLAI